MAKTAKATKKPKPQIGIPGYDGGVPNDAPVEENLSAHEEITGNVKTAKEAVSNVVKGDFKTRKTKSKATKAEEASVWKLKENTRDRADRIKSGTEATVKPHQKLIDLGVDYEAADGDDRDICRDDALAEGVKLLEGIAIISGALKAMERDARSRLEKDFNFRNGDIKELLKERRTPFKQYEMELGLRHNEVNRMHVAIEKRGLKRAGGETERLAPPAPIAPDVPAAVVEEDAA